MSNYIMIPITRGTYQSILAHLTDDNETIDAAIRRLASTETVPHTAVGKTGESDATSSRNHFGFELLGQWHEARTARGILIGALRAINDLDNTFLQKLSTQSARTRRYVANSPIDLYPGRPDLAKYTEKLTDKWYVGTNYSIRDITRILRVACELVGLTFGRDLIARFG